MEIPQSEMTRQPRGEGNLPFYGLDTNFRLVSPTFGWRPVSTFYHIITIQIDIKESGI